jgi:CPA2 family monovalent cation:H+ antiporter-2
MAAVSPADFKEAMVVLGAAALVVPLFHRLRLSPVLGFMLVGMAVGPSGLGSLVVHQPWLAAVAITDTERIANIAELGVVLLLFVIGLEISFERLMLMRRLVFGLGSLQLVLSAAALACLGVAIGLPERTAIILGTGLAMSSTAVVLQVLADEKRLGSPAGRIALAILLLQDIAVVPVLLGLEALKASADGAAGDAMGAGMLAEVLALTAGKAAIAVLAVLVLGRLTLRPLFRGVARTRSPELFVAACLLVVLGTGLAMAAAGLSMALGALIAGLLLAETEYRRQVIVTIEPFKGLLLGVFLVSVGMSLSLGRIAADPVFLLGAAAALVMLKLAIVLVLAVLFGLGWHAALRAGLLLGPGGEFSLVITALAARSGLLDAATAEDALVLAALTMAAIPVLSQAGEVLLRHSRHAQRGRDGTPAVPPPPAADGTPRVILCGFGRVGQIVADMLDVHRIPYVALDSDADVVARHYARGRPVFFGDMTRTAILAHLDLDTARAVIVTVSDRRVADALVTAVREQRRDLLLVARAHDADHAAQLYAVGATDAVPETVEASLQLAEAVLVDLGVPMGPVIASIHEKRASLQGEIRAKAPGAAVRPLGGRRLRDALAARPGRGDEA